MGAEIILDNGNRAMNADFDLGGNNITSSARVDFDQNINIAQNTLEGCEFLQGDNNTAGASGSEWLRLDNVNNETNLNASGDINFQINGTTVADIVSGGLRLSGNDVNLQGGNVTNAEIFRGNNQVKIQDNTSGGDIIFEDDVGNNLHFFSQGFHNFAQADSDSASVTGDLWRSSTTTDELKYNDGAVVQLS